MQRDESKLSVYIMENTSEYYVQRCKEIQNKWGPLNGKVPYRGGRVWLGYYDGTLAGFALGVFHGNNFWLRNCVVSNFARGAGLQKYFIQVRVEYARVHKAASVITYTDATNYVSANNLIKCGFKYYGISDGYVYWKYNF